MACLAGRGDRVAEELLAVALEQRTGRVGAGQDRAGRAGGRGRLDPGVEAGRIESLGAGEHECGLAPGGKRLVGAGDHDVGAELHRVSWQVGVEAEVRGPGCVDDQGNAVLVGGIGQSRDVAHGADVRRVADEDRPGLRVGRQGASNRLWGDAHRQPGGQVDLGPHPHRPQPGEHQPQEEGAVQRPAHDDGVSVLGHSEGDGLVGVRGAAGGEAAEVRAPQARGAGFGVDQCAGGELHRVEAGVERDVSGDHVAHQVGALLVAGDGERCRWLLAEP
jgi:hypothetical protein